MTSPQPSSLAGVSDWSAFFGGVFGGLLVTPWQQNILRQRSLVYDIAVRSQRLQRDVLNIGLVARRPKRPWAYWQFKNGSLAELRGPRDLPYEMDWHLAYDRSLGCDVVYAPN